MNNNKNEKWKIYMREYMKTKYNTDENYKESKKNQNNEYYHKKKCENNKIFISHIPRRINFN
jgi:hypothetical protein